MLSLVCSAAVVEANRILAEVGAKAVVVTGRCAVGYSLVDWPGWYVYSKGDEWFFSQEWSRHKSPP